MCVDFKGHTLSDRSQLQRIGYAVCATHVSLRSQHDRHREQINTCQRMWNTRREMAVTVNGYVRVLLVHGWSRDFTCDKITWERTHRNVCT